VTGRRKKRGDSYISELHRTKKPTTSLTSGGGGWNSLKGGSGKRRTFFLSGKLGMKEIGDLWEEQM